MSFAFLNGCSRMVSGVGCQTGLSSITSSILALCCSLGGKSSLSISTVGVGSLALWALVQGLVVMGGFQARKLNSSTSKVAILSIVES